MLDYIRSYIMGSSDLLSFGIKSILHFSIFCHWDKIRSYDQDVGLYSILYNGILRSFIIGIKSILQLSIFCHWGKIDPTIRMLDLLYIRSFIMGSSDLLSFGIKSILHLSIFCHWDKIDPTIRMLDLFCIRSFIMGSSDLLSLG